MQLGIFFSSGKTVRVLLWYVAKGFRFWKVFLFLKSARYQILKEQLPPTTTLAHPNPH